MKKINLYLVFIIKYIPLIWLLTTSNVLAATKVAITQIVDHSSLNANRQGIEDALKGRDIEIIFQNAHGKITTASQIAKRFISKEVDILVGISTPSSQSLLAARKDSNIPIIFSGITDAVSAKLISSNEEPGNNITGAIDTPPIAQLLGIMHQLIKAKKIGFVYNPSEANSVKTLEYLVKFSQNAKIIPSPANNSINVAAATTKLIDKVDAIILPSDNTVFSAMEALLKVTMKFKIPVFSSDSSSIERGVLLSVGYNQYDVGFLAGQKIARILDGEDAGSIPVTAPDKYEIVINENSERKLGLKINKNIKDKARIIK